MGPADTSGSKDDDFLAAINEFFIARLENLDGDEITAKFVEATNRPGRDNKFF